MKNDEVSPNTGVALSRAMQDAAVEDLRQTQHDLRKAQARIAQLEAGLSRASSTAETIALKTEAEGQRRNVNDAVREALITSLQSDNKQLLIRIDKNILDLASAEERLQDLSTELILADEKEQRRIAREMHDELGQDLTALKMLITRGKNAKADEAKQLWMEAGEISETLLQTVRDICSRLRPQVLDDLGLIAGLSVHLKNFGSRSGLTIEFTHGAIDEKRLTPIVQSVIFDRKNSVESRSGELSRGSRRIVSENPWGAKRCNEAVQFVHATRLAEKGICAEFISAIEVTDFVDMTQDNDEQAFSGKRRTNPLENLKAVDRRHF